MCIHILHKNVCEELSNMSIVIYIHIKEELQMKRIATFVSGLMVGVLLFGGSFAWGGLMAEESYTPFYLNGQPVEVKA